MSGVEPPDATTANPTDATWPDLEPEVELDPLFIYKTATNIPALSREEKQATVLGYFVRGMGKDTRPWAEKPNDSMRPPRDAIYVSRLLDVIWSDTSRVTVLVWHGMGQ